MILNFLNAVVFSTAVAGGLPANLECHDLDKRADNLGKFHIYNVDKGAEKVWMDRDARGDIMKVGHRVTELIAHNGCDNYYEFRFPTRTLRLLALGRRDKVRARLKYYHSENISDASEQETRFTTVECVVGPEAPERF